MPWCRDLEPIECPVRRDWMSCVKGLDALYEGIECPV